MVVQGEGTEACSQGLSPMSVRSFRMLLRLVELAAGVLQAVGDISRRVETEWQEVEMGGH